MAIKLKNKKKQKPDTIYDHSLNQIQGMFKNGGGIHIKPENKGKFNATKKATGKSTEELTHSKNPLTRKRAVFAQNAKKWHHENGGPMKYEDGGNGIQGLNIPDIISTGVASSIAPIAGKYSNSNFGGEEDMFLKRKELQQAKAHLSGPLKKNQGLREFVGGLAGIAGAIPGVGNLIDNTNLAKSSVAYSATKGVGQIAGGAALTALGMPGGVKMIGQGINSEVGGVGGKLALNANDSTAYRATNITGDTAEGLGNLVENVRGQVTKGIPQTDQLPTGKNGLRGYSKYLYGGDDKGQLEQYNTGLHKDMPDNFANAQLNGSPIQLQRKENIFRKENGGDYVFTDNLKNPETGNVFSKDAEKIDKKTQKPFFDKASLNVKNYELNKLSKVNDAERAKVESKQNGGMIKATNGVGNDIPIVATENYPKLQTFDDTTEVTPLTVNSINASKEPSLLNLKTVSSGIEPSTKRKLQFNNVALSSGDKEQLLGQAIPTAYNLARSLETPEKQRLYLDNSPLRERLIKEDYSPAFMAENAAKDQINNATSSDAVRRANLIGLNLKTQEGLNAYKLGVDNQNSQILSNLDLQKMGQNRFNIGQRLTTDDINSKNKAAIKAFGAAAATGAGQGLVDYGKFKNQGLTNQIELSALNEIAADYKMDPETMMDLYKNGKIKIDFKNKKVYRVG